MELLGQKLEYLDSLMADLEKEREKTFKFIQTRGHRVVQRYSEEASEVAKIPLLCIPFVHEKCREMINELNGLAGVAFYADDVFVNTVLGLFASALLMVPFLSVIAAEAYIETLGESYLKALSMVVKSSSEGDLKDTALMKKRIQEELQKLAQEV